MSRRQFKAPPRFFRHGAIDTDPGYRMGHTRSFCTLRAAILGVRLDIAELQADGHKLPLDIVVRFEHIDRHGKYQGSETVALWKRGRFVWIDPLFKRGKIAARRPK